MPDERELRARVGEARPAEPDFDPEDELWREHTEHRIAEMAAERPDARVELETVVTEAAKDAIEDAVAAHDFNALASIAHTLRVALEANEVSAPLAALTKERDMHDAMADAFADRAETAESENRRLREQLDAGASLARAAYGSNPETLEMLREWGHAARAALGDVAAPPNQTTDEVGALRQRAPETREETEA